MDINQKFPEIKESDSTGLFFSRTNPFTLQYVIFPTSSEEMNVNRKVYEELFKQTGFIYGEKRMVSPRAHQIRTVFGKPLDIMSDLILPCKLDYNNEYNGFSGKEVAPLYCVGIDDARGPFVRFLDLQLKLDSRILIAKRITELAKGVKGNISLNLGYGNQNMGELKEWWFNISK